MYIIKKCLPYSLQISPAFNFRPQGGAKIKGSELNGQGGAKIKGREKWRERIKIIWWKTKKGWIYAFLWCVTETYTFYKGFVM